MPKWYDDIPELRKRHRELMKASQDIQQLMSTEEFSALPVGERKSAAMTARSYSQAAHGLQSRLATLGFPAFQVEI